jgi:hypothetical protein
MPSTNKDKRTKEQILKLLDRAMEQEEQFAEKIASLEKDLAECRQKAENPRHELLEEALSSSKIPFRIDYYRTAANNPLKGIVEHLPTRESRSFTGDGLEEIIDFLGQFLPQKPSASRLKSALATVSTTTSSAQTPAAQAEKPAPSALLRKVLPDVFAPPPAPTEVAEVPVAPSVRLNAGMFEAATDAGAPTFWVEIPMQGLEAFDGKACQATLDVESLESGQRFQIAENCVPHGEKLRLPTQHFQLGQGAYRVTALLTLQSSPHRAHYRERRLVVLR